MFEGNSKIQNLILSWPPGAVFPVTVLVDRKYSHALLEHYRRSKWLESVGIGALKRAGDKLTVFGGVFGLQQLKLSVHVGAGTALELEGLSQYAPVARRPITLVGRPKERLPSWFRGYDWGVKVRYVTTDMFGADRVGLEEKDFGTFKILVSSPERAMFEELRGLKTAQDYQHCLELMENLWNGRPILLEQLLKHCTSFKVKRLFLHLASRTQQPWLERLSISSVDLGRGKRSIIKGGSFDSKYLITVPQISADGS